MLDTLLEGEIEDPDLLECYFLEALYCSLGASLLEDGRLKFDECVKRLASLPSVDKEGEWANPGELPSKNQVQPVFLLRMLWGRFSEEVTSLFPVLACVDFAARLLL